MKVTLRDLFWLVLVCALAIGWWVSYSKMSREMERLEKVEQSYLSLQLDFKYVVDQVERYRRLIMTSDAATRERREE